ncbi:MAG: DUF3347 domain-containing protein [Flavobacteriaceae bacterium]|nr:DUF3347 domain-containing protein [Flavobacteriaceae bacterium]
MKLLKLSISMLALLLFSFTTISCADGKKSEDVKKEAEAKSDDGHDHAHGEEAPAGEMDHSKMESSGMKMEKSANTAMIITHYLQLKDALVVDDAKKAAKVSGNLFKALNAFDISGFTADEQKELKDIIEDAAEHAEHIEGSPIDHQREHLVILSVDVVDLIAIAGSDTKLYQDHCPMANDNKGAIWLSANKEIQNPYMGAKMPTCGSVQKEI